VRGPLEVGVCKSARYIWRWGMWGGALCDLIIDPGAEAHLLHALDIREGWAEAGPVEGNARPACRVIEPAEPPGLALKQFDKMHKVAGKRCR